MNNQLERVKFPLCPVWCSGHDGDGYQTWGDHGEDGFLREHGTGGGLSVVQGDAGRQILVDVLAYEGELGLRAPVVTVALANGDVDLSPDQTRELVAALLGALDLIEGRACPGWCTADHDVDQQRVRDRWERVGRETGEPVDPRLVEADMQPIHRGRKYADETGLVAQVEALGSDEPVVNLTLDGRGFELPLRHVDRIGEMVAAALTGVYAPEQ